MAASRLGCLETIQAFITHLCGAPRECDLSDASLVEFTRILNDISEARVEIPIADPECCNCLRTVEPFCNELHIFRNGETVWSGVITDIVYRNETVVVEARDVLEWSTVRYPECPIDTRGAPVDITELAKTVLAVAFADGNPCVFEHIQAEPTDLPHVGILIPAFEQSAFETIQDLGALGLHFTALGRRILLGGPDFFNRKIGILTEEFILGEIEIHKSGGLYANRVFVRYGGDNDASQCAAQAAAGAQIAEGCTPTVEDDPSSACPAVAEVPDSDLACYGRVERLINIGGELDYQTAVETAGVYIAAAGQYVPRTLEMPPGSRLSPDTPWTFNEMVPGMLVAVALTEKCIDLFQTLRLQEVVYRATPEGEEIGVTLSPTNVITGAI